MSAFAGPAPISRPCAQRCGGCFCSLWLAAVIGGVQRVKAQFSSIVRGADHRLGAEDHRLGAETVRFRETVVLAGTLHLALLSCCGVVRIAE